jgi:hypothetical protein
VRYRITHTTSYEYAGMVGHSYNEARLLPRECQHQQLISARLEITPKETDFRVREDFFGNKIAYFAITEPHSIFIITAISEVGYSAMQGNLIFRGVLRGKMSKSSCNRINARKCWMLASTYWILPTSKPVLILLLTHNLHSRQAGRCMKPSMT